MNIAGILNLIIIVLELPGFAHSISDRGITIFAYYTQISNLVTIASCVCYVGFSRGNKNSQFVSRIRYLSSCMLTMTFIVTVFVLIPMGAGVKRMLFSGNGLYHHLLCPILSVSSYILLEEHTAGRKSAKGGRDGGWKNILDPVAVTFVYGIIMILLNAVRRFDGPYPFFQVHNQSVPATILWIMVLMALVTVIAYVIHLLGRMVEKKRSYETY